MKFSVLKEKFSKEGFAVHPAVLVFMLLSAIGGAITPFSEPLSVTWTIGLTLVGASGITLFYVLFKILCAEDSQ